MSYLIFAGATYYADGGAYDLVATLDEWGVAGCEKAVEIYQEQVAKNGADGAWCHVYDLEQSKIVWKMGSSFGEVFGSIMP